jgi:hypothetical protein
MQRAPSGSATDYRSGWGLRLLALAVFGGAGGIALFFGLDEGSDFPAEAAYLILAICAAGFIGVFAQQMLSRVSLLPDGLRRFGARGLAWDVKWEQISSVSFDPTQGAFPLGAAIRIYDRQGRLLLVPKSIAGVQDLGRRVLDAHARMNQGEIMLLLEHGDDIRFGDAITVNRDLMRAADPQTNRLVDYSLRDFRGAVVKAHALEITLAGKPVPLRIKLKELPNAHLLQPVLTKARALGPKIEMELPVDHDQLDKTDAG